MEAEMKVNINETDINPVETEYGEEVMCAGWNPAVALINLQHSLGSINKSISVPSGLEMMNETLFLQRLYSNQR